MDNPLIDQSCYGYLAENFKINTVSVNQKEVVCSQVSPSNKHFANNILRHFIHTFKMLLSDSNSRSLALEALLFLTLKITGVALVTAPFENKGNIQSNPTRC